MIRSEPKTTWFRTCTVLENHTKSLIQHCERSELRLHLSGQKVIKNAKNGIKSVTRQVSFNRTKIGGKCQNWKTQMRHVGWFSNTVLYRKWCLLSDDTHDLPTFFKCFISKVYFKLATKIQKVKISTNFLNVCFGPKVTQSFQLSWNKLVVAKM